MQEGDVSSNQRSVGFLGSFRQYANYIFGENANKIVALIFEISLMIIIIATLAFFSFKVFKVLKNKTIRNLLPIICMVVMTLPLLFTNSGNEIYIVAPRCYFLQYFMLVIFVYSKLCKKNFDTKKFNKKLNATFVVLVLVTVVVYAQLGYMGAVREHTVDKAIEKGCSTVEVVKYPKNIERIQWSSNFIENKTYLDRYKNFKTIPKDTITKISSEF